MDLPIDTNNEQQETPIKLKYIGLSDVGCLRENNEDSWGVDTELGCYIVSDGMGGALAGEIASDMVVKLLPGLLKKYLNLGEYDLMSEEARDMIFKALSELNEMVYKRSIEDHKCSGMGATLVMLIVQGTNVMVVHVGDSRAYLLRDGELSSLTKDHNMLQVLLDEGVITNEQAVGHPAASELLCDIGMPEGMFADVLYYEMKAGDRILLCTDGLNGMVSDHEIQHILNKPNSIDVICQELINSALCAGGHDNVTALVIECI